jgi:hypothetical protein
LPGGLSGIGTVARNQGIHTVKDNVITISHDTTKAEVLRNWKILLNDEMYSIRNYDTDIFIIETEYRQLKNASTRFKISVNDSVILIRGFATNGLTFGGDVVKTSASEFRNEYRNSTMTVMAIGFQEMKRLANKYKDRHNGSIGSYQE